MGCCVQNTDGVPSSSSGSSGSPQLRELEIVWTEQGTRTLAAGVESFTTTNGDQIDFDYTLAAGDDVVDVSPANGLQWTAGAGTSSSFTQASVTATRLISSLGVGNNRLFSILDIDVTWEIRVDTYGTLFTFPAGSPYFLQGLYGLNNSPLNAGVRLVAAGRGRLGGGQVWAILAGASGLIEYDSAPGPTTNVTGFVLRGNAMQVHAGNWPVSTAWADLRLPICWSAGRVDTGSQPPLNDQNTNLAFGWATGGLGNASIVRLERTRVQARSF
jgi:hypothetical protein